MVRRLGPDERALWARVTADIAPLPGRKRPMPALAGPLQAPAKPSTALAPRPSRSSKPSANANTLDGSWDRRIERGSLSPEVTLDLHGHTLDTAWAALDRGLERAIGDGVRTMLLITGKAPRAGEGKRGLIRAAVPDWLAASRHAAQVAAVRGAHPRHGGTGALYIVLRRRRSA